jgi:flagellar basal-body rod protein FlgC
VPVRELVILDSLDWSAKFIEAGGLRLTRSDGSVRLEFQDAGRAAGVVAGACLALRRRMAVISENVANSETTRPGQVREGPPAPYRRKVLTVTANGSLEVTEDGSGFRQVYRPDHSDADGEGNVQLPNVYVEVELLEWHASCREYEVLRLALGALSSLHVAPPASLLPEPVPPRPAEPRKTAGSTPAKVPAAPPAPTAPPAPSGSGTGTPRENSAGPR